MSIISNVFKSELPLGPEVRKTDKFLLKLSKLALGILVTAVVVGVVGAFLATPIAWAAVGLFAIALLVGACAAVCMGKRWNTTRLTFSLLHLKLEDTAAEEAETAFKADFLRLRLYDRVTFNGKKVFSSVGILRTEEEKNAAKEKGVEELKAACSNTKTNIHLMFLMSQAAFGAFNVDQNQEDADRQVITKKFSETLSLPQGQMLSFTEPGEDASNLISVDIVMKDGRSYVDCVWTQEFSIVTFEDTDQGRAIGAPLQDAKGRSLGYSGQLHAHIDLDNAENNRFDLRGFGPQQVVGRQVVGR